MALKRTFFFFDTIGGPDVTDGSGPDGGGSHYEALDDRMLPCNFTWREVGGVPLPNF